MNKKPQPKKPSQPNPSQLKNPSEKNLPEFSWYVELCQELPPAVLSISSVDDPAIWKVDSFLKSVMDGLKEHHLDLLEAVQVSPMQLLLMVIFETEVEKKGLPKTALFPKKFIGVLWERISEDVAFRNEVIKNFPGKQEAVKKLRERGLMK